MAGAEGLGLACRLGRCFCTSCRGLHRRPAPLNTLRVPRSLNHFTQCQNKNGHLSVTVFDLAGAEGLEPSARGFGDRCSTNWAIPLYLILPCGNHFDIIHILHHFVNNNYFEMFLWSFFLNLIHNRKNDNNRRRCYCSEKLQSDDALPMTKTGFRIIFLLSVIFQIRKRKTKR